MPKDDINYRFTENGVVYDFYDVFVPAEYFREPSLWTWGQNIYGQLGINDTVNRSIPVTTFLGGTNWKSVSCSSDHISTIKTDGTLWTWGRNSEGQLGVNNTTNRTTPVTTFLGGTDWKSVSGGGYHTTAIKTDGTLWAWGNSGSGALGNNSNENISIPVTTFLGGNNWKSVSCGRNHTSAIKTDGTLWTWGFNDSAQLGIIDNINRSTPVTTFLGGNNWKSVSGGRHHTAAIKTDGSLWTWGRNVDGQLGVNNTSQRNTPVTTFLGGNNWKSVSCGGYVTSAIKTDGTLWIWGRNSYGQLGTNDTADRLTPVTTFFGGNNWKLVFGGEQHTAAIKTDGTLWTWGRNNTGQLGINDTVDRSIPVTTFLGGNNWKSVSCGENHTSAIQYTPDP